MAPRTIMIIEDDVDIRDIISAMLTAEGYVVRVGKDVSDLYEIEKNAPDLILLDNWLDGKTGHDICVQLKNSPKTKVLPVVLISATQNLEITAKSCGADAFISKPFELENLLETVKKYVR